MIIDTHQHVFWHGRDDVGLIADMDEHGIDKAWLLTWEIPVDEDAREYHGVFNPAHVRADGTHAGMPLSDVVMTGKQYKDRFVLGYCPHPAIGDASKIFEAAYRIHGVRVCGEWKCRILIDDPRCIELFRTVGGLGCPVVFHLDAPYLYDEQTGVMTYKSNWYGGTIDNLERTLIACPDTNFIGHAPGFWRYISGNADTEPLGYPNGPVTEGGRLLKILEEYTNLYADMSADSGLTAMSRDVEFCRGFIERFADRLLFGRDYYGNKLQKFLDSLELPAKITERIYHGNAKKLVTC